MCNRAHAEEIARHVYDPLKVGCLLLYTAHETTLDALVERPLDEGMHVFVGAIEKGGIAANVREDGVKPFDDGAGLFSADGPGRRDRLDPREAPPDIVLEQPAVERKRPPELEHVMVRLAAEPARPHIRHGHIELAALRIRADWRATVSTGRPQSLMNPSAAVWSNRSPLS